ncbi:hypothetical protein ACFRAE_09435 [Sphingobacterium sp. HJSM2_6]|uniref:hypothetical protein n=1 Tax=Sphingobacterium sp. HJSM2_6 TaxID=3366264 RepID=UPI003BE0AE21
MKKLLLALAIGTASLVSFSSCTKEYITNITPGVSYVYNVDPNDWERITNGDIVNYRVTINVPDLKDYIFEDGHVDVSMLLDSNPNTYENIPATIDDYHYSANYSIGKVTIYAEYRGSSATALSPEKALVKVVLTESEIGN